jgi:choline dehydrogenase-like flavoprotein
VELESDIVCLTSGNQFSPVDFGRKYSKRAQKIHTPTLPSQLEMLPVPPYIEKFHGTCGPTQTSFVKWYVRASTAFLPALANLGLPINPEPMSGNNVGGFVIVNSIDPANSTRSYSATSYLLPNIGRKNLVVLTGATVARVVIKDKVAIGVEFLVDGLKYTVKATKEVILSAGAIQSPQILELSGVGGRDVLEKVGVECVVDNPNVGENLQEHHCTFPQLFLKILY